MEKVHKFTLDLTRGINDTSIEVVTGDYAAHKFEITLVEDGYKPFNLEGTIVRLIVLKPDGHTIQQDCTIVDNNGKVSVLLMLDTINVPGTCKAEIQIWDNEVANKRLTSAQFYFRVRKSLQDDETVESTDQFSMLQSALEQAQNIDEKIQNKADLDENGKVPLSQLPDNIGVDEELRQEVEEARGGHTSLNDRLGTSEQNLASHLAENPTVSIRKFGNVGAGQDATQAFIDAHAYCTANKVDLDVVPGDYLITGELPFPTNYQIKGHGHVSNLILNLTDNQYCFKNSTDFRYAFGISNLRFTVADGGSKNVGAIYVESALRGSIVEKIWTYGMYKPIYVGDQAWSNFILRDLFLYLLEAATIDTYALTYLGNTFMGDNIEILGGFYGGLKINGSNVVKLNGFNIGGSSDILMKRPIRIDNSASINIKNGWIEVVEDIGGVNGTGEAIYIKDSTNVKIDNVNIASGSIYIDGGDAKVDNIKYAQALGGLRIMNGAKVQTTQNGVKHVPDNGYKNGELIMLDAPITSNKGLLMNPIIKTGILSPLVITQGGTVTVTTETTDYLSGDRSIKVVSTNDYQGVKVVLSNAIPNKEYTFIAVIKHLAGAEGNIYLAGLNNTTVGVKPDFVKNTTEGWHRIVGCCKTTTTTLEVRIIGVKVAPATQYEFLVDSVEYYEGYNPNANPSLISKKDCKFTATTALTAGAWEVDDYVARSPKEVGQPKGWFCTVAGTPGTWVSEGNL